MSSKSLQCKRPESCISSRILSCCLFSAHRVSAVQGALAFWLRLRCSKSLWLDISQRASTLTAFLGFQTLDFARAGTSSDGLTPGMEFTRLPQLTGNAVCVHCEA